MRGWLACVLLLCTALRSQDTPIQVSSGAQLLCRAWLAEQLEGDREGAMKLYRQAADDEQATPLLESLAWGRLAELARVQGKTELMQRAWRRASRARPGRPGARPRTGRRQPPGDPLSSLRRQPGVSAAVEPKRFSELRRRVAAMSPALLETRPLLSRLLRLFPPKKAGSNPAARAAALRAEIRRARKAKDTTRVRRLSRELLAMHRASLAQRRETGVSVIELRLQGKDRQADRIEQGYYRHWGRAQGPLPGPHQEGGREAAHAGPILDLALQRLGFLLRNSEARERGALEALRNRLLALREKHETTAAVALLRKIPFYGARLLRQ